MERQLKEIFYLIIFKPAMDVVKASNPKHDPVVQIRNAAEDPLREALAEGRVQYQGGVFSGQFSAAIGVTLRSIGAVHDKRAKVYRLDAGKVPAWVKAEASTYQERAKAAHRLILEKLNETREQLHKTVNEYRVDANETIGRIDKGFEKVGRELEVMPQLSEDSKGRLSAEYSHNMKLWIEKFSKKQIEAMRVTVEENATEGYRFDRLVKGFKMKYGVTARHAKFLARQETGLFMAKYRQERFQEAGVRRYKWSTSHDARVRHSHKDLDGRTFSYNQPPIVDMATGRKGNPGQDYNCRCVDMPVLEAA